MHVLIRLGSQRAISRGRWRRDARNVLSRGRPRHRIPRNPPQRPTSPPALPSRGKRRRYATSTPPAANGSAITRAHPAASRSSRSATADASSDRTHTNTVGPAPEIVAPSAPNSRAPLDQLHRPRIQRRPARLVQPILEPSRHQLQIPTRQPEHEQARAAHVEHGVGHRHLGRQRRSRLGRPDRPVGHHEHRRQADGGSSRSARDARADHEARPAARRRRCPDAPRAAPPRPAGRRRRRSARRPRRDPPRRRPRWSPARRTAGCRTGS